MDVGIVSLPLLWQTRQVGYVVLNYIVRSRTITREVFAGAQVKGTSRAVRDN